MAPVVKRQAFSTPAPLLALVLALALAAALLPSATAQVNTGQGGVCCAYILNSSNGWQLVCNNPSRVSRCMKAALPQFPRNRPFVAPARTASAHRVQHIKLVAGYRTAVCFLNVS